MMSKNNLELTRWGRDGNIRLAYWDSLHGDDVVFLLNEDGTCRLEEGSKPTNLVKELIKLCEKIEEEK